MQRHRYHPVSGKALDRKPLGDELGQWSGKTPPTLVLEPMHRVLDRTFVSDR